MRQALFAAALVLDGGSWAVAACPATLPVVATVTDVVPIGWEWGARGHIGAYLWDAHVRFADGAVHIQRYYGRPHLFKDEQATVTACTEDGIRRKN